MLLFCLPSMTEPGSVCLAESNMISLNMLSILVSVHIGFLTSTLFHLGANNSLLWEREAVLGIARCLAVSLASTH
jgi:hypothetical protein